eukprot:364578-Chlamydomonas_euryale.AAC.3
MPRGGARTQPTWQTVWRPSCSVWPPVPCVSIPAPRPRAHHAHVSAALTSALRPRRRRAGAARVLAVLRAAVAAARGWPGAQCVTFPCTVRPGAACSHARRDVGRRRGRGGSGIGGRHDEGACARRQQRPWRWRWRRGRRGGRRSERRFGFAVERGAGQEGRAQGRAGRISGGRTAKARRIVGGAAFRRWRCSRVAAAVGRAVRGGNGGSPSQPGAPAWRASDCAVDAG